MIEVLKSEKEYRAHPAWNYSKLKWWVSHTPLSWRKKFILGDNSEDADNSGIKNGSLVDCKLLGKEGEFEEKYHIAQIDKLPTPQNLRFCDNLIKHTLENTNSEGIFVGDFVKCFEQAYIDSEIQKPGLSRFISDFEGSSTEKYYRHLRESSGKISITYDEIEKSDYTIKVLKTDENTKDIFSGEGINQLPIVFEFQGKTFKMLLDRLKIENERKVLKPFDLKTTYQPQEFGYQYLKLGYYIQDGVYFEGVKAYRDEYYPNYDIEPFKFVAVDMPTFNRPLVWQFDYGFENPWTGFTHRGKKYKGINEILEEIDWHTENDEWRIKKSHFDSNGQVIYRIGE